MGLLKDKFEILQHLDDDDLQKATTSSQIEDVWTAILVTKAKIAFLVDQGVGQKDKTFSSRAELKKYKFIEDLLSKRYKFLQKRIQKKKDKSNQIKQKKSELYKLLDSGLMSSLIKESVRKDKEIEKLKFNQVLNDRTELIQYDTASSDLQARIKAIMDANGVDAGEAIRQLNQEAKKIAISNEAAKALVPNENLSTSQPEDLTDLTDLNNLIPSFDVLNEDEPLTKQNPLKATPEQLKQARNENKLEDKRGQ